MNHGTKPRPGGNKAKNDKSSILVDAKMLLRIYNPIFQHMPKIERIDGLGADMRRAILDIISHFSIAYECEEVRQQEIRQMIGSYGKAMAVFDLLRDLGVVPDTELYLIAERMDRIEKGILKWRNSLRGYKS